MKKILCLLIAALSMMSCGQNNQIPGLPVMQLKAPASEETRISDEIQSVEYIPLELTDDSQIAELLDLCVTDDYIFILSTRQNGILQFDRKGAFVRKVALSGNGPGETGDIVSISVDEANRVLCASEYFYLSYFSFDGEFIQRTNIQRPNAWQYCIGPNIMAEAGRQFVPLNTPSMFALGIFDIANDDTLAIKYSLGDPALLPLENTAIKTLTWNYSTEGLLCRTAGNDTVWNLSKSGIQPAFLIDAGYPDNIRKELPDIRTNQSTYDNEYEVFSFFETPRRFYVKAFMNNDFYLFSLDKASGIVTREKSRLNSDEIFRLNRQLTAIGMRNETNNGLPIWPFYSYPARKLLIQLNTGVEICYLKEQMPELNSIPVLQSITGDSNPLITLYHLK